MPKEGNGAYVDGAVAVGSGAADGAADGAPAGGVVDGAAALLPAVGNGHRRVAFSFAMAASFHLVTNSIAAARSRLSLLAAPACAK